MTRKMAERALGVFRPSLLAIDPLSSGSILRTRDAAA
jgi:hypothetical protein